MPNLPATAALLALATCLAVGAAPAKAQSQRKIYLNGVDLTNTEVKDKKFKACTVRFDQHGNLHITAPGLEVKKKPAASRTSPARKAPAVAAELSRRYYLVGRENRRGATQYHVAVYINDRRVTTIRSNAEPAAVDITRFVKPGPNKVRLFATKKRKTNARAATSSRRHVLEIQVGEGTAERDTVTLKKTLLRYKRTAAEALTYDNTYRFTAR